MQYLGFEPKNEWREYSFQVRYGGEDVRDLSRSVIAPLSENELELRGMQDLAPSCDHLGGWGSDRSPESTTAPALSTELTFSASCASFFCLRRSAFSRCFSCLFISFDASGM